MTKIRLGDLLLENHLATEEQLEDAYQRQKTTGQKLGHTLVDMDVVSEEQILQLLSKQLKLPYIELDHYDIDYEVAQLLPETYARRYRAILLERDEASHGYLVGMADPQDIYGLDELQRILKQPLKAAIVSESLLIGLTNKIYRRTQELTSFAEELSGEIADQTDLNNLFGELLEGEDVPVVKLLLSMFKDAIIAEASDIHIEPGESVIRIRFRIDGLLQENILDDPRIARPLIQRLKMRAGLDISEKRIPQDGRFQISMMGKNFDVRVSTLPTSYGESVVMRLLDQSSPVQAISRLGIRPEIEARLRKIYNAPHGLLIVTGPTGSGKTTTLYSILSELNQPEKKIITVEDPVEYKLSRVCQVQVNSKIGLDFSKVLRAILRQDPDIILIGEIRDVETATIAMRSAVTGHFVMATLHTNDAMSSALRLIEMGAKSYMVASSLTGIIAQRLVRKLCENCPEDYQPTAEELAWVPRSILDKYPNAIFKQAVGCNHCNMIGYKGRTGVYELIELDEAMIKALRDNDTHEFALAAERQIGELSLKYQVFELAFSGKTSLTEAIRVVGELSEPAI